MTSFPAHLQSDVLANGLLLIDKPPHWEVAEVVAAVQRATRARKVASVAPLDAAASGLMLLCFGAATRLSSRVERAAKRYEGSLVLGAAAAALDVRGGSLVSEALPWGDVTDEELQEAADGMMAALGGGDDGGGSIGSGGGGESFDGAVEDDDDGNDVGSGGAAAAAAAAAPGGGGTATLSVLPPRFRLRQYPSSFHYYEEDYGPDIQAIPLRLHDFKAWRASEEEIFRASAAAASAAAAAGSRASLARPRLGLPNDSAAAAAAAAAAGDAAGLVGRVVRFSVQLSGRAHVRSLVGMYGRRLRTCACLDELRRTQVGVFDVGDAWPLEAVLPTLQRYKR